MTIMVCRTNCLSYSSLRALSIYPYPLHHPPPYVDFNKKQVQTKSGEISRLQAELSAGKCSSLVIISAVSLLSL